MTKTADNDVVIPTIPRKTDGFLSRRIGEETIVVPVRGGVGDLDAVFTLNAVGATIWNLIDGATSVDRLAAAVSAEYEVTADVARGDVDRFVRSLTECGLLAGAPAAGEGPR